MDEWKYIDEALLALAKNWSDIVPIEDLLLDIKNENIISENEYRVINAMSSRRHQNDRICRILKSKKDSGDFILFCKLLYMHSNRRLQTYGSALRRIATIGG